MFAELNENLDKPVEFYVYNTDTDEVRTVVIMPSKVGFCRFTSSVSVLTIVCGVYPSFSVQDWGGDGILGANVAHGFLHILPASCCNSIGRY